MGTTATQAERNTAVREEFLVRLTEQEREFYARIPGEVGFIPHEFFDQADAEARLFGEQAEKVEVPVWTHYPEVPADVETPKRKKSRLSAEEEELLFLRYNYARKRLAELIEAQNRRATTPRAREMIHWHERALAGRARIVRANMALVIAMAKRTRVPNVAFTDLVSEGNMALLRSVEKFDVSRGFKFSTYACRSILKSFNRLATKTSRHYQRFPAEYDPDMEQSDYDVHRHDIQREEAIDHLRYILTRNEAKLSSVERTVVMERFAIGSRGKGKTLAQVGKMVGLTNERVRQIQAQALAKLRTVLDQEYLAV